MLSETVNPANGSVSLRIQVPTAKARGITLPFSFNYDSNGVNHIVGGFQPAPQSDLTVVSQGGWSYGLPLLQGVLWNSTTPGGVTCYFNSGYTFQDPAGARHNLGLGTTTYSSGGNQGTYLCSTPIINGGDQQYLASLVTTETAGNLTPSVLVSDSHGTVYHFTNPGFQNDSSIGYSQLPDYIEDSNGNQMLFSSSGTQATYTDTTGRAAIAWNGPGTSGQTNTITASGMAYQVNWTSTTPNFSFPNEVVYDVEGYMCEPFLPVNTPETVVNSITLANGEKYHFYYGTNNPNGYSNPYGLLSEIDYPTGAWVRYTWKMTTTYNEGVSFDGIGVGGNAGQQVPTFCQSIFKTPVIATRTVGLAGSSTPILSQSFTYSTSWAPSGATGPAWLTKQTTVSTTDNVRNLTSQAVYTYTPSSVGSNNPYVPNFTANQLPLEAAVQYSNWGNTATLRTVTKTWNNQFELASEQDKYNALTSEVTYQYGLNAAQITTKNEYDYSTSPPGTLLRSTVTNYQAFNPTPIDPGLASILDRPCQVLTYDGNSNRYAETDYYYDGGTALCPSIASTQALSGTSSYTGHDETNYGTSSSEARGNLTQKVQWANTGTSPKTTYTYDETGQVLSKTDPCGNGTCSDMTGSTHTTTYSYANSYTILSGGENTSYSTNGNTNTYLTSVTDPVGHIESFTYDYNNGQLTALTDENSQKTAYLYNDPFSRATQVNYPDGGQTALSYIDSSTPSVTKTELVSTSGSGTSIVTTTTADSLGRTTTTDLSSDPDGPTYTATTYDAENRVYTQSNPYRATGDPTYGITTYTYDSIGRITNKAEPDGSAVATSYAGNQTTVTDEASNARTSQTDGLGRLTNVWEAPNVTGYNYQTIYTYDPLNDLTSVNQTGGSRTRTFTYDSLSRIKCAANPEVQIVSCPISATGTYPTGAITYSYDANSNLSTKTAPSPNQPSTGKSAVTTTYSYDVLNRLTSKSYNDSYANNPATAATTYGYDGVNLSCPNAPVGFAGNSATNGIGRRTAMCFGAGSVSGSSGSGGSKSWQFDPMGRVAAENDRFIGLVPPYGSDVLVNHSGFPVPTISTDTAWSYYLNGDLLKYYYPGGPNYEFTTVEGAAGRILSAGDIYCAAFQNGTYSPDGQLASALVGWTNGSCSGAIYNGDTVSNTYNNRLQPVLISASTATGSQILNLTYNFNLGNGTSGKDNGNVIQIANGKDSNRTQNFIYDPLNRIQQAYTSGPNWGETYASVATSPGVAPPLADAGIDSWGNLTNISGVTGKTNEETLNCAPANASNQLNTCFTYDAAGNLIKNGTNTYTYDAESRLVATDGFSYTYDGDGERIGKCTAGTTPGTCASNATGTFYWKQADGTTIAESDLGGNWTTVYGIVQGQIATRSDVSNSSDMVHHYFQDRLHSTSIVTDCCGNILNESDYYPYGREIVITGGDSNHYKFTGKERDAESDLDQFGARYYASSFGRFMTPDWSDNATAVPYANFGNPQSLNLYSYVENNPTAFGDPDGHCAPTETICGFEDPGYIQSDLSKKKAPEHPCRYDACVIATPLPGVPIPATPDMRSAFQRWVDAWNARIDADRPPRQPPTNLLQDINNIVLGAVPVGGIRFGNNPNQEYHTFRHVEAAGIDKQAAADAITNDLAGKAESLPQGLTKGEVNVGGKTLEYNAYKLPDGTINVGRITVH